MPIKIIARKLLWSLLISIVAFKASAQSEAVYGEYIIKFKAQVSSVQQSGKTASEVMASSNKMAFEKGQRVLGALKGLHVKQSFAKVAMMHVDSVDAAKLQYLENHPDVEFIEPNYVLSLSPTSAQKIQASQVQVQDTYDQSNAPVRVTDSWALQKAPASATKTIVAVVDTGVDINHAVFKDSGAIWQNLAEINGQSGIDDDGNGYIDDFNGWNFVDNTRFVTDDNDHGTHVAGIVLGAGQDIFQNPLKESKIKIMPLKFLNYRGSGTTGAAVSAIYYAVNNGARVINNSWGGPSYSRALHDAYKYAYDHSVVLVTAAGNDDKNLDSVPTYPAAFDTPSNITVDSSTDADQKSGFSNYSQTLTHVFSPGNQIVSSIPGSQCSDVNNLYMNCFAELDGTSMATPLVAGIAALAIREAPQLSAYQIRGLILSAIDSVSQLTNYSATGGRINAYKATQIAQSQVAITAWSPSYSPVYKTEMSSKVVTEMAPAGCGLVKGVMSEINQGPPSAGQMMQVFAISLLMLMPLLAALKLRRKPYVRRHERYSIAKEIMISMGDQVISTASQTLAVGGLSFRSDQTFEKGQKIKLRISDVDGEIDGEIVWSSETHSFGVKFLNVTDHLKEKLQLWSANLTPIG